MGGIFSGDLYKRFRLVFQKNREYFVNCRIVKQSPICLNSSNFVIRLQSESRMFALYQLFYGKCAFAFFLKLLYRIISIRSNPGMYS